MKLKSLFAFMLGALAVSGSAQGFKDAVEYFRADQPEEAEIIINRTINDPATDKSMANYFLGKIALQRENFENAKNFFEKGITVNPNNGYNYVGLGEIALNQGNESAANDFFKQASKLAKKDAVLLSEIARAYYNADATAYQDNIQKYLKNARKADKDCPAIYILEADMLAPVNIGESAGYYEMAMSAQDGVNYPEAFVKYARTYFPVNPKYAIDGLKKLLELQPNSALAQRELAEKYYDNDQLTMAAEQYGKYIQNPNHFKRDEQRYVGLLYFGKKYDESNALAAKLLSEDPDNFYMKRMRMYNYAALEDYQNALVEGEKFFNAKGDFVANDYKTFGDIYIALGQDSIGIVQYEKALVVEPEKASLYKDISQVYTAAEIYDKAADAHEKFIELEPEHTTNDLMILARRYQNAAATSDTCTVEHDVYADKAIKTIEIVYEKAPNNLQVLSARSRIYLIANNNEMNDEVEQQLVKILEILDADPANTTNRKQDYIFALNLLGKYNLSKDREKAKAYYNRFLEINPENEALKAFVEKLNATEEEE
ncbi:MAG: hypothetical protein IKL83_04195 [Muribaculaceae bacterium]|nr:hypothetical protein [Muribaculaceae bacterium]